MPQYPNRQFLDFEKPIKDVYEQIEDTRKLAEKNPKIDYTATIEQLENSIIEIRKEITTHLTPWQRVQLSRHPDRPYTLKYIEKMCTNFVELHGDRNFKDDKAMVGGFAQIDGENHHDYRATKRDQYQGPSTAKFWDGQSGGISKSITPDETGRKI